MNDYAIGTHGTPAYELAVVVVESGPLMLGQSVVGGSGANETTPNREKRLAS
jgi:hypothetical protein